MSLFAFALSLGNYFGTGKPIEVRYFGRANIKVLLTNVNKLRFRVIDIGLMKQQRGRRKMHAVQIVMAVTHDVCHGSQCSLHNLGMERGDETVTLYCSWIKYDVDRCASNAGVGHGRIQAQDIQFTLGLRQGMMSSPHSGHH